MYYSVLQGFKWAHKYSRVPTTTPLLPSSNLTPYLYYYLYLLYLYPYYYYSYYHYC